MSFFPCNINTGASTFLMCFKLLKPFFRKTLKSIDIFSLATSLNEVNGENKAKNIHYFLLAKYVAGAQPKDLPIIIIFSGRNFIFSIKN